MLGIVTRHSRTKKKKKYSFWFSFQSQKEVLISSKIQSICLYYSKNRLQQSFVCVSKQLGYDHTLCVRKRPQQIRSPVSSEHPVLTILWSVLWMGKWLLPHSSTFGTAILCSLQVKEHFLTKRKKHFILTCRTKWTIGAKSFNANLPFALLPISATCRTRMKGFLC